MAWQQIYDPFSSMVVSTTLAAVPVVVMLVGLGFLHLKAHIAAGCGLLAALAVRVVQVGNDRCGVEQHQQVLRQKAQRVDAEFGLAEVDRAGFSDAEGAAHDAQVHVLQLGRAANGGELPRATTLGSRRADHLRSRESLADQTVQLTRRRRFGDHAAHARKRRCKGLPQRYLRAFEARHLGQR